MPSQAKVLSGWRRLALHASRRHPVCQPFLFLTASLGCITDTLTLTGEYTNANDFEVRPEGLDCLCQSLEPSWHKLIKGGVNFGWLAVWVLSPDWLSCKSDFCQALRWSRRAWGGECGPCPDFASYTLAFALQLRKITKNFSQGSRKALGWSAPNAIRLGDLAIVGDGLYWPAGSCRPWLTRQTTGPLKD
jgi:hypothetical protein